MARKSLILLLVAAALGWHAVAVYAVWTKARGEHHARDFASYYYALQVAADGGDPYDVRELSSAAQEDHTRRSVYPYFYPPPFLLFVAWALPLELVDAYRVWFWLDEALLAAAVLALWRWWRPLGPAVGPLLAVAVATCTAIPNNHLMGQANLLVLALVFAGLWQAERGRDGLGGALVGTAVMLKMAPALFVAWWLLHRRWRPALAAVATGGVLVLASLAVAPLDVQLGFWLHVLPGFSDGAYNGLTVPVDLFGNHSIPNLWHLALGGGRELGATARALSLASALGLVGGVAWLLRRPAVGPLQAGAHASAVALVMLLVPVYTYEHHLVWALPGAVLAAVALLNRQLHPAWAAAVVPAWVALGWELSHLKATALSLAPLAEGLLRESKFAALVALLIVCVVLGRSHTDEPV